MQVCVIGLGEIGLSTAKYCRGKGLKVFGYDISEEAAKRANQHEICAFSEMKYVPKVEVYIICVSTWKADKQHDLGPVFEVAKKISSRTTKESLVSIESTVVPGASRKIYNMIFHGNVKLVHVPHRYWAKDPENHGVRQPRVIGAINQDSSELGERFYSDLLDIPLRKVSTIEESELCKISENAYRYVQIAFAEELKMICEDLALSFKEVREACNTKWNTEILEALDGIQGKCLPTDIRSLSSLSKHNNLLKGARETDDQYREWLKRSNSSSISH